MDGSFKQPFHPPTHALVFHSIAQLLEMFTTAEGSIRHHVRNEELMVDIPFKLKETSV